MFKDGCCFRCVFVCCCFFNGFVEGVVFLCVLFVSDYVIDVVDD